MKKISLLVVIASSCLFFTSFFQGIQEDKPVPIPPGKQRLDGDRLKGYEYLITGDYIKSGIPYDVFLLTRGKNKDNLLGRTGLNSKLSYPYTATKAFNGKIVVVPNCLQCHAQVFDNQLIIGLGNSMIDFTINQKLNPKSLRSLEKMLKNNLPRQYEAAATFIDVAKIATQFLTTEVRGVNSADRLAEVLAAHRDPVTFKWNKEPMLEIPSEVIPSDTPPWWLLKKKNAMFYNGFGRGDFGRFLMASNLLTVNDTTEAWEVDNHMPDVLAYIYSIKPPQYPKPIDMALAKEGQLLFQNNCSKCHGDYSETESYPNLLIPESIIRTDSFLFKSNYSNPQFVQWFNNSWFTKGGHPA